MFRIFPFAPTKLRAQKSVYRQGSGTTTNLVSFALKTELSQERPSTAACGAERGFKPEKP